MPGEVAASRPKAPSRLGWIAYAIAAVALALDQLSKWWIVDVFQLPLRGSIHLFGPLSFTYVQNQGVSFGLLQAEVDLARWALTAFSILVAIVLAIWARRPERGLLAVGLGLIIGGAIGNAIDRATLGFVTDFIDVQRLGFFPWIFNIADSAITLGVVALLADSFRREKPVEPAAKEA
jgi:signal peptidase II